MNSHIPHSLICNHVDDFFLSDFMTDTDIKHSHRVCGHRTESQHSSQNCITDSHIVTNTNSPGIVWSSHNTRDNNDKCLARCTLQASYHHKAIQPTKLGLDKSKNKLQKLPNMQNILFSKECH